MPNRTGDGLDAFARRGIVSTATDVNTNSRRDTAVMMSYSLQSGQVTDARSTPGDQLTEPSRMASRQRKHVQRHSLRWWLISVEQLSNLFSGLSGECRFATALAHLCRDMFNQYSPSVYNKHFANEVGSGNGSSTYVTMKHGHLLLLRVAVAAFSYCTLRPAKTPVLSTQLTLSRERTPGGLRR